MREIELTRGKIAIVDDEDFDFLSRRKWFAHKPKRVWYASGFVNGRQVLMHRAIMKAPKGSIIDHINDNGLDNRRSNLRFCTNQENSSNARATRADGFKGISYRSSCPLRPWRADIYPSGKHVHIGYYPSKEDAARAYDAAALRYYGPFARLNFPSEHPVRVEVAQ